MQVGQPLRQMHLDNLRSDYTHVLHSPWHHLCRETPLEQIVSYTISLQIWASYQIRKIGVCECRECREHFPCNRGLTISTSITARAWRTCRDACQDRWLAVSFEVDGGENVPGIPGARATRYSMYPMHTGVLCFVVVCLCTFRNPLVESCDSYSDISQSILTDTGIASVPVKLHWSHANIPRC